MTPADLDGGVGHARPMRRRTRVCQPGDHHRVIPKTVEFTLPCTVCGCPLHPDDVGCPRCQGACWKVPL